MLLDKLVFAIDFDGTLCVDKFPEIGEPHQAMIDFVMNAQVYGKYKTILWTCRHGEYLQKAVDWCISHGLYFDAVNQNLPEIQEMFGTDTRKIYADVYIDDKNMELNRVWL